MINKILYVDADRCICCGAIIPEGRWMCPSCERKYGNRNMKDNIDDILKEAKL